MEIGVLSKYKAVLFDVGGTLLRVEPSVGEVYAIYARPFGFKGSGKELNQLFHREWINSGGIDAKDVGSEFLTYLQNSDLG